MLAEEIPLFLMTLMLLFRETCQELLEVPENQVSFEEKQTVVMKCRFSFEYKVGWFDVQFGSAVEVELGNGEYLRRNAKSYSSIDGQRNLHIKHRSDAAQTYICLEPGTLMKVSAELIFIKTGLTCNDSSTEDLVNLSCSIEFRGNWSPAMEWREHSSLGDKVLTVGVNTTTVPSQRVTSTLVMPGQKFSRNYTCTTKFDISGKPNTTTATNVPNYNRSRTFSVFIKTEDEMAAKSADNAGAVAAIGAGSTIVVALPFSIVCLICIKRRREEKKMNQQEQQNPTSRPLTKSSRHPSQKESTLV